MKKINIKKAEATIGLELFLKPYLGNIAGVDDIYVYNKPVNDFMHHRGTFIAGATKIDFGGGDIKDVVVVDDIFTKLPDDIKRFFLMHEVGHIKNGDINRPEKEQKKMLIKRYLGFCRDEYAADRYAMNMTSKWIAKYSLRFLLKNAEMCLITRIELIKRLIALSL